MESLCVLTWASLYRGSPAEKTEAKERKWWCQNKDACSRNLSGVWFPLHPADVSEVHRFPRQYKGISTTDPRRKLGTLSEELNCYVGNINSLGSGEKTGLSWACTADLWLLYVLGWPRSWYDTSPWGTGLHMCILCGKWHFFRDGPQIGQFASCSGLAGYAFLAPWARIAFVS